MDANKALKIGIQRDITVYFRIFRILCALTVLFCEPAKEGCTGFYRIRRQSQFHAAINGRRIIVFAFHLEIHGKDILIVMRDYSFIPGNSGPHREFSGRIILINPLALHIGLWGYGRHICYSKTAVHIDRPGNLITVLLNERHRIGDFLMNRGCFEGRLHHGSLGYFLTVCYPLANISGDHRHFRQKTSDGFALRNDIYIRFVLFITGNRRVKLHGDQFRELRCDRQIIRHDGFSISHRFTVEPSVKMIPVKDWVPGHLLADSRVFFNTDCLIRASFRLEGNRLIDDLLKNSRYADVRLHRRVDIHRLTIRILPANKPIISSFFWRFGKDLAERHSVFNQIAAGFTIYIPGDFMRHSGPQYIREKNSQSFSHHCGGHDLQHHRHGQRHGKQPLYEGITRVVHACFPLQRCFCFEQ